MVAHVRLMIGTRLSDGKTESKLENINRVDDI